MASDDEAADREYGMSSERARYVHRRSCELLEAWGGHVYGPLDHEATRRAAEEWEQMQREDDAA